MVGPTWIIKLCRSQFRIWSRAVLLFKVGRLANSFGQYLFGQSEFGQSEFGQSEFEQSEFGQVEFI
jgi:hypothetical protein